MRARWRVGLGATRVLRATERAGAKQAGSGRGPDERGPVAGGESGSVRDVARGLGRSGPAGEQGGVGRVLAGFWAFWVLGFVLGFSFLFLNFSPTKSNKV